MPAGAMKGSFGEEKRTRACRNCKSLGLAEDPYRRSFGMSSFDLQGRYETWESRERCGTDLEVAVSCFLQAALK